MADFAAQIYQRLCSVCSEEFSTGDPAARWRNAKGNPRYLCPKGCEKPSNGWKKEEQHTSG